MENDNSSLVRKPVSCVIDSTKGGQSFRVDSNGEAIVEVTLEYDFSYEGRGLIALDNKISHVLMALNPKESKAIFPVFALSNSETFAMMSYSSGEKHLKLISCKAAEMEHAYLDLLKEHLLLVQDGYKYRKH